MNKKLKVLVACEISGRVRDAFNSLGHDAYSCDLYWNSGKHLHGDVRKFLDLGWDLMIAHPPCTYLAVSGARWNKEEKRKKLQAESLDFVNLLMNAPINKIAIENPIGVISTAIRKPDQIIHPYEFGHGETKSTCLWLKNLPKLKPTNIVSGRLPNIHYMSSHRKEVRQRERSLTYLGIAKAMSEQWGGLVSENEQIEHVS